jgi:hypothetical protein
MLKSTPIRVPINTSQRFLIRAILYGLLVMLLAGCAFEAVDIQQEQGSDLAGELLEGDSFGQTFTPGHDGLNRIDLYTATYARENTRPVMFSIRSIAGEEQVVEGEELVRMELAADQISNSGPTVITFPPLPDTAGKTLYFSIESPGSVPGDAITVYMEEGDVYPGGQMYIDGEGDQGDIAFIAYTRESFTPGDVWDDFYSRASQDRSFFIFYCLLMTILLIAITVGLAWSASKRRLDEHSDPDDLVSKENE